MIETFQRGLLTDDNGSASESGNPPWRRDRDRGRGKLFFSAHANFWRNVLRWLSWSVAQNLSPEKTPGVSAEKSSQALSAHMEKCFPGFFPSYKELVSS
jgi:hypothetical protein